MKTRFASALFALALPLLAQQEPAAAPAENLFYKAYWLEKGERNFAEAMTLYDQFLAQAPEHRLAKFAATNQFELLTRAGKTKDADAFAKKYEKLLGSVATGAPARAEGGDRPAGGAPERGDGARGEGGGRRGNFDPQARMAELKKQLEDAKAAGDTEKVAQLEARIKQMEQMAQGGGAGQGGGGRRGGFGQAVEFAKMDKAALDQFKTERLTQMSAMVERLKENGMEDRAKQVEESITSLKKALDDNKLDEAQKIYDKMREGMGRRRGGGGGGDGAPPAGGGANGAGGGERRGGGGGGK